jgi:hypothetical protein
MPYTLRLYLYLFVAGVLAVVCADWLSPLGFTVNIIFAVVVGRWMLGRKESVALVNYFAAGMRTNEDRRLRSGDDNRFVRLATNIAAPFPREL